MSDEHFLSRWSRLKHQHASGPQTQAAPPASAPSVASEGSDERLAQKPEALPELPSLESIGPSTDIRAFLSSGVPAELTRAALRTAWSADPAIRDFVGLAENAWDFNAPETIHGFAGPLNANESVRLARLFNPPEAELPEPQVASHEALEPSASSDPASPEPDLSAEPHTEDHREADADSGVAGEETDLITAASEAPADEVTPQLEESRELERQPVRRSHGSALPS
jgi:hypothetical protein